MTSLFSRDFVKESTKEPLYVNIRETERKHSSQLFVLSEAIVLSVNISQICLVKTSVCKHVHF